MANSLGFFTIGGVDSHDNPRAVRAWHHIRWFLCAWSLLAIPAFYGELTAANDAALFAARALYLCMFAGFACAMLRLLYLSKKRRTLLSHNRLDVLIAAGAALSAAWGAPPWQTAEWVLRLLFVGLVAVRIVLSLHEFFTPNRIVGLLAAGAAVLALAGGGFMWLEPRVHSYADGLWLAFESSATVGYGDIAPTTPASRVFAVFVVLLGYGMLSLVFASIAAAFIGQEERALRREMHRDIKHLNDEIARLHGELHALRDTLANAAGAAGQAPRQGQREQG
ncbi:potassium channel family protein [Paraburkholderia phymatum]|uniref:Ion transport 2 domain protein n=1 Tax=Paraburkholderia phymatum (strain DSM 17167 / CIP 108236 / LMG 21445 / STM815) TaxID=391038 RepID=B2JH70_PARP8|nr:potassium channel family protein [Paraburkholderia phymatum]ACC70308.1 Ion transport 2 domain protein [Paraburkholderia phymatum STM815]